MLHVWNIYLHLTKIEVKYVGCSWRICFFLFWNLGIPYFSTIYFPEKKKTKTGAHQGSHGNLLENNIAQETLCVRRVKPLPRKLTAGT